MKLAFPLVLVIVSILLWSGCIRDPDFLTGDAVSLEFSVDTLQFDTVFTQRGTVTRSIRVRNPSNQPVRISNIFLEEGDESFFRLNVDGIPGNNPSDIEIFGEDSIYIFVEATIDPDQPPSASPFVIEDKLVFQSGETQQKVVLEAWGQNAVYLTGLEGGRAALLSCDLDEFRFDDPRPYVIFGQLLVDSCTLVIPAGQRVYFHGGLAQTDVNGERVAFNDGWLYILENGRLLIEGTAEEPVLIQTDRLEPVFQDDPGQWTGVVFAPGSQGNRIEFAEIRNSIVGLYVDSAADLSLRNSTIAYTSGSGLVGIHSRVDVENSLFHTNGGASVQLVHGGDYRFTYTTMANFGVDAPSMTMSNFICYDDPSECLEIGVNPLRVSVVNSILSGSRSDQIQLLDILEGEEPDAFDLRFSHSLVRVDDLLSVQDSLYKDFFETICNPCTSLDFFDPLFADINEDDFRLDSMSLAIGEALPIPGLTLDRVANPRDPDEPDSGAYEYVREE
jgi:hypothetical protein